MRTLRALVMFAVLVLMVSGCGGGSGNSNQTTTSNTTTPIVDDPTPNNPIPDNPIIPAAAVITGISPEAVVVGSAPLAVIVSGQNFTATSAVRVDGAVRNDVTVMGPTQISVPMSVSDLATLGDKVIEVSGVEKTVTFTVKEKPWVTAVGARTTCIEPASDGLLYAAYTKNGDVYLCRFAPNGERVRIGGQPEVWVAASDRTEYAKGIMVVGGFAYVVVLREYPNALTFGEGLIEKVDLATGGRTEKFITLGGQLTSVAMDEESGVIYAAFNFTGQLGEYKSAVVGVNAADAAVIFEEGWTNSPRITAVRADATHLYLGGVIVSPSGTQARQYVRKEDRATKAIAWESWVNTGTGGDDTLYPNSFVLDTINDALYFSGAWGHLTDTPRGALLEIIPSSTDGAFAGPAYSTPGSMAYAYGLLIAGNAGDLYGVANDSTIVRIDPATPSNLLWKTQQVYLVTALAAADGIVYVADAFSDAIIRLRAADRTVIN